DRKIGKERRIGSLCVDAHAARVDLHDPQVELEPQLLHLVVHPHAQEVVLYVEQIGERLHQVAGRGVAEFGSFARHGGFQKSQLSQIDLRDGELHGGAAEFEVDFVEADLPQCVAEPKVNGVAEL